MSAVLSPDSAGATTAAAAAAPTATSAAATPPGVLYRIAELATQGVGAAPPAEVRDAARRCLIDWLGVAIAGWDEPPATKLRLALGVADPARAFASAFDPAIAADHAALALATASHALDYDDTDYVNLIHVSSTLFPGLLALCAQEPGRLGGARLLDVFNAAYEAEDRIGAELGRKLTARGWHVSGVIGHLGSALACGMALELDAAALAQAMAISATASSGFIGAFGTMSKPLQLARGAADGLIAARLARAGFTGPLRLLEADPGFTVPLVGEAIADWSSVTRDWGQPWAVLRNAFKPHASCMITHPIIDAAVALKAKLEAGGIRPDAIARVTCSVNALAPKVAGISQPATGFEGKFSTAYCCAAGLIIGHATPDAFSAEQLRRADIQALLQRIEVAIDATIGEQQAHVTVRLADGRELSQAVEMAKGNPGNPLTDAELDRKFLLLAERPLGGRAREVLAQLHAFERVDDVGAWLRALNQQSR